MKKITTVICLAVALAFPVGCKTATSTTPPAALAPGFSSQADQTMDQVLVGAHSFYNSLQSQVGAGTYVPSPSELTALNNFGVALNAAEAIYIAFHNGTATQ